MKVAIPFFLGGGGGKGVSEEVEPWGKLCLH